MTRRRDDATTRRRDQLGERRVDHLLEADQLLLEVDAAAALVAVRADRRRELVLRVLRELHHLCFGSTIKSSGKLKVES